MYLSFLLCKNELIHYIILIYHYNLLKTEIERLKLNMIRLDASANMEYIKNVVYRYLTTKDSNTKLNMINAMAQILQFNKQEKSKAIFINS